MKHRRFIGTLVLVMAGTAATAWGGPGQSTGQILVQDLGARSAALSDAYTAMGGDLESMGQNPAGLAALDSTELRFMHFAGVESIATEWLAGATPVMGLGTLGAQVLYRGQPSIDNGVNEPPVDAHDLLFGVSYATAILPELQAGFNAKLLLITLGPVNTSALVLDLGVRYLLDPVTHLGLSLRQLGQPVTYLVASDPLPETASVGISRVLVADGPHEVEAEVDADYLVPDANATVRVGAEYRFRHTLSVRLGYAYSAATTVNSFSTGVGFAFKIGQAEMCLDYTVRPQIWETGDFDMESVLSLGAKF